MHLSPQELRFSSLKIVSELMGQNLLNVTTLKTSSFQSSHILKKFLRNSVKNYPGSSPIKEIQS